ncbi:MAG: hypothetical protein FJ030_13160 [Chloroflexi bacterium]|nr:hypothetical protein [Chloroflexota bacterium]
MSARTVSKSAPPSALGADSAVERQEPLPLVAKPLFAATRFAPTVRRLVVLIPDADTDESRLARQLWAMASRNDLPLLLLGVCHSPSGEPRARRRLAAIAALARDACVRAQIRLEVGADWITAARAVRRNSDLIVCHSEQQIARWGVRRRPLSQRLMAHFDEPVGVLTGFYPGLPLGHNALTASVPFIIFAAFTGLQILIHKIAGPSSYTLLMALSVLVEYGLIGFWQYRFG